MKRLDRSKHGGVSLAHNGLMSAVNDPDITDDQRRRLWQAYRLVLEVRTELEEERQSPALDGALSEGLLSPPPMSYDSHPSK